MLIYINAQNDNREHIPVELTFPSAKSNNEKVQTVIMEANFTGERDKIK